MCLIEGGEAQRGGKEYMKELGSRSSAPLNIGLAKKFIRIFFHRHIWKTQTKFLANPILHTLLLSKKGFLKEKVLLDQCLVTKHTLYEGSNTIWVQKKKYQSMTSNDIQDHS